VVADADVGDWSWDHAVVTTMRLSGVEGRTGGE
jgi:hypothetical protein